MPVEEQEKRAKLFPGDPPSSDAHTIVRAQIRERSRKGKGLITLTMPYRNWKGEYENTREPMAQLLGITAHELEYGVQSSSSSVVPAGDTTSNVEESSESTAMWQASTSSASQWHESSWSHSDAWNSNPNPHRWRKGKYDNWQDIWGERS